MPELEFLKSAIALDDTLYWNIRAALGRDRGKPHAVILSGGRTPLSLFRRVARNPFPVSRNAYILFSDERHVPADAPESNYGHARPMFKALGLPEDRVLRVQTELPLDEAAAEYDRALRAFRDSGGLILAAFLGLGPDGHTCSLFTQADLDAAAGRYAIAVERPAPPHRVSVTPALLETAQHVIFAVAGNEKREIVRRLIAQPDSIVAGRAVAHCRHVHIWQAP